jgi:tetratricopeptide (TPR) repeat protein
MHRPAVIFSRSAIFAASIGLCVLSFTPDALAHGGLHERIAVLGEKIAAKPDSAELHFELAAVYCQHEEWTEALVEIEKTEELAPGKFPTALFRGQVASGFGRWEEALGQFDSFLTKAPGHAMAHLYRARVLMKLARLDEALTDYREAFRCNESPDADFVSEIADALVARQQAGEALRALDKSMERLGPVPSLQTRALELDLAAGRFDSALVRTEILQNHAVRPESWMARRASILQRAGREREARAVWAELISRIEKLPNLQRGSQQIQRIEVEARKTLGALEPETSPVASPVANSR